MVKISRLWRSVYRSKVDHHELYASVKFNEEVYSLLRTPFFNVWKYTEDQYVALI